MPSTHLSLHYHVVFSTKNREPYIADPLVELLHSYLGGLVRDLGGVPECIGGVADHVHMLLGLKATHRLCDVLREIKSSSSKWMHEVQEIKEFGWQDGYGAFTVSDNRREIVATYIRNQKVHHERKTFQEEYVNFLREAGVEYDERYLW